MSKELRAQDPVPSQKPVSVVVRTAHWVDYTEPDFSGFYFDLIRQVYTEPEFNLDLQIVSYPAALKMLDGRGSDIVLGVYNTDLNNAYFSELPVERERLVAVMTAERAEHWQGVESLKNLRVGSIEGYAFEGRLPASAKYAEFESVGRMLRMLQAGRLDIVLDYQSDIDVFLEKMNFTFAIKENLPELGIYFAFRKDAHGLALKKRFDQRYNILLESGEIWESMVKFLGEEYAAEAFPFICENGKCSLAPDS